MPSGPNIAFGIQRLIDANQRYARNTRGIWLRLRNFQSTQGQQWSQMGFVIAPTGTAFTGTVDIPIDPPPSVAMVSMHNIGQSEGKLRFGARTFFISASFVDAQVKAQNLVANPNDQDLVWRGTNVVGLICDNQLFSIEIIAHNEIAGKTISYSLTGNALETK